MPSAPRPVNWRVRNYRSGAPAHHTARVSGVGLLVMCPNAVTGVWGAWFDDRPRGPQWKTIGYRRSLEAAQALAVEYARLHPRDPKPKRSRVAR